MPADEVFQAHLRRVPPKQATEGAGLLPLPKRRNSLRSRGSMDDEPSRRAGRTAPTHELERSKNSSYAVRRRSRFAHLH